MGNKTAGIRVVINPDPSKQKRLPPHLVKVFSVVSKISFYWAWTGFGSTLLFVYFSFSLDIEKMWRITGVVGSVWIIGLLLMVAYLTQIIQKYK
jgi:hypothetical protein